MAGGPGGSPFDGFTVVATIVRPFGRNGEVKAAVETDYPEAMTSRKRLFVLGRSEATEYKVEALRHHQGALLLKLEGVNSIDEAEKLRGMALAIPDSERADLEQGEYWLDDIVGLEVVTDAGESFGMVTEVLRMPANDVWVTDIAMVPAIADIVISVDVPAGKITVRAVEGLKTEPGR